jgi:hypothetical protein
VFSKHFPFLKVFARTISAIVLKENPEPTDIVSPGFTISLGNQTN